MAYRLVIADNCDQSQLIANAKKYLTFSTTTGKSSSQAQYEGQLSGGTSGNSNSKGDMNSDSSVIEIDDTLSSVQILTNVFVTIDNPTVNGSQNGNVTESITLCGTIPTISAADSGSNANVSVYSQL